MFRYHVAFQLPQVAREVVVAEALNSPAPSLKDSISPTRA
jgi:hypothetical protein